MLNTSHHRNRGNFPLVIIMMLGLTLMAHVALVHGETPDGEAILEGLNASPEDLERLNQGEVINFSGEPWEQTERELAADSVVVINRRLADVLAETVDDASLVPKNKILDFGDIRTEEDLANVGFTADELKEAERFLKAKPGKELNLSMEEIADIKSRAGKLQRGASEAERIAVASDVLRNILVTRYQAYRKEGLGGIAPYARSSRKNVLVGDELRLTTEMHEPIEQYFPAYYSTLLNFPADADCCQQRFSWLKVKIQKRPTWALVHRITLRGEDFALVTERYYYTSHSLNSLQVTVAWLPYEDGTYLGLATSASADILTGFIGKTLRALGRDKAGELVGDVLTDIKSDLETESQ
ncbi:MAG: hypothetical protein OER85_14485 [Gammaproteobacteria bacterium]|nr:hypothetical protein [Gammaproteobacteria bacterium]